MLQSSQDVECDGEDWRRWRPVAALFFILYPIGIPLAFGSGLAYCRRSRDPQQFAVRFGFLTQHYSERYYFYELAVLGRKLVVALCLTFISASAYIQAGAAFAAVAAFFVVHGTTQAYEYPRHNIFESVTATIVELIMVAGIMFQDSHFGDTAKTSLM